MSYLHPQGDAYGLENMCVTFKWLRPQTLTAGKDLYQVQETLKKLYKFSTKDVFKTCIQVLKTSLFSTVWADRAILGSTGPILSNF